MEGDRNDGKALTTKKSLSFQGVLCGGQHVSTQKCFHGLAPLLWLAGEARFKGFLRGDLLVISVTLDPTSLELHFSVSDNDDL